MKATAKSAAARKPSSVKAPAALPPEWKLRLYVAGNNLKSVAAFENLQRFCEEHLAGRYHIEVVDLVKHPKLARGDQILAVPTVVRRLPAPIRKMIGTLSDTSRLLVGLDLRAHPGQAQATNAAEGSPHVR